MSVALQKLRSMEALSTLQSFFPPNNQNTYNNTSIIFNNSDELVDDTMIRLQALDFHALMYTYSSPASAALIALYIPLFCVAFAGNLLVLLVVLPSRHMRSVTNYFLVNLALADLLVTVICVPVQIGKSIYVIWVYGQFLCKFTGYIQGVATASSVFTIMTLSLDRYLAIRHPVLFRTFSAGKHATRLVVTIWFVSCTLMIPILFVQKYYALELYPSLKICGEIWSNRHHRQAYDTFLFVLLFVLPGLIVMCSYSRIGCALWTEGNFMYRTDSDVGKAQARKVMLGRRKIARMLAVVAMLFGVCWMPHHCLLLFNAYADDNNPGNKQATDILPFTLLLGHLNSALNPILYCYMNKSFRVRTLRILKHACLPCCHCTCHAHKSSAKSKSAYLLTRQQGTLVQNGYKRGGGIAPPSEPAHQLRTASISSARPSRSSLRQSSKLTQNTQDYDSTGARDNNHPAALRNEMCMDNLKPAVPRLGRRRKSGLLRTHFSIPTTINEEHSCANSRSPSVCSENMAELASQNGGLCSCIEDSQISYRASNFCTCEQCLATTHTSRGPCSCDQCLDDVTCGESRDSDSFCEMCADAGLIECCHLTPEPALRLAILRQLQALGSSPKPQRVPTIEITVESYT